MQNLAIVADVLSGEVVQMRDDIQWKFLKLEATDHILNQLESHFDVSLPLAYRELTKINNGARPTKKIITLSTGEKKVIKTFLTVYPTKGGVKDVHNWLKDKLPENSVPFASDPFGNYYFFKYLKKQSKEEPTIFFWNHEEKDEKFISSSFINFLDKLGQ